MKTDNQKRNTARTDSVAPAEVSGTRQASHTKGPWKVVTHGEDTFLWSDSANSPVGCAIYRISTDQRTPEDETRKQANARLIAAAPALLEACKAWVEPSEPHIELAQAWKMAQAAIALAEKGESK